MTYENLSTECRATELARNKRPEPLFFDEPVVTRNCLKCSQDFQSRGDRICPRCNTQNRSAGKRVDKGGSRTTAGRKAGVET